MKKLIFAASVLFLMSSCKQEELDRSNMKNDSLVSVLGEREKILEERENTLNEFITSFNEVERNLDCVAVRQKIVYTSAEGKDLKGNQKDRINQHINAINDLMDENRKAITGLKKSLRASRNKNKKLEESLASLTEKIAQKDAELADLNNRLNELNAQLAQLQTKYDTLVAQNERTSQDLTDRTTALHTAYYIIGRSKELREANVVDKRGGLLGIGKTTQLGENFNKNKFTKIDYTQVSVIPVNSEKVKIITNHPTDAYRLEKDGDKVKNLVITDPQTFWSVSKFLVIQGNPVDSKEMMSAGSKPPSSGKF